MMFNTKRKILLPTSIIFIALSSFSFDLLTKMDVLGQLIFGYSFLFVLAWVILPLDFGRVHTYLRLLLYSLFIYGFFLLLFFSVSLSSFNPLAALGIMLPNLICLLFFSYLFFYSMSSNQKLDLCLRICYSTFRRHFILVIGLCCAQASALVLTEFLDHRFVGFCLLFSSLLIQLTIKHKRFSFYATDLET